MTIQMTSISDPDRAYVWVWLPGCTAPVPAGVVRRVHDHYQFGYGRGYLDRPDAISLYEPELPLRSGWIDPVEDLNIASALRDAGPDSWGQRVILAKLHGVTGRNADPGDIDQITYFLESGSNRTGGLDFQHSPETYVPRGDDTASLAEMLTGADDFQLGRPINPALEAALLHGTSVGGARPKAVLRHGDREMIAKFTTSTDVWPEVAGEAAAFELARRVGIDVPHTDVTTVLGRRVLLSERFDRTHAGGRKLMVSALTMLALPDYQGRYATYPDLLDKLRAGGGDPHVGRRLFERIAFNIAIGNNDDHARNHAAFWDGKHLDLTPAYDLTPQVRSGETSSQAMAIGRRGERDSSFRTALDCCSIYGLTPAEGREIVQRQIDTIEAGWDEVADQVELGAGDRALLFHRSILNPSASYGLSSRTQMTHQPKALGPKRVSRGVPTGGQFASRSHTESPVNLDPQATD